MLTLYTLKPPSTDSQSLLLKAPPDCPDCASSSLMTLQRLLTILPPPLVPPLDTKGVLTPAVLPLADPAVLPLDTEEAPPLDTVEALPLDAIATGGCQPPDTLEKPLNPDTVGVGRPVLADAIEPLLAAIRRVLAVPRPLIGRRPPIL